MRTLIVYESFFGCTRAVAEAVAQGLRAASPSCIVTTCPVAAAPRDLRGVDLLLMGGPTHALGLSSRASRWLQAQYWGDPAGLARAHRPHGRPSERRCLRSWVRALPWSGDVPAAVFSTRISGPLTGDAARPLARRLRRRGLVLLVRPEGFAVAGVSGPVGPAELIRAQWWGASLACAMRSPPPTTKTFPYAAKGAKITP